MSTRLLQLPLALILALGMVAGVSAQTRAKSAPKRHEQAVLPVWNNASGKLEALLVLEPADGVQAGTRWHFGDNSLDTTLGVESGDSLALLCNRKSGISGGLGNLSNNCMLATLGDGLDPNGSRRLSANAALNHGSAKLGISVGSGHDTMPAWLTPGAGSGQVDVNDLTVFGQKNLSRQGFVRIAGTVAKARLASPNEFPALADRWSSKSIAVGGGFGAFGASIVGHVVDMPGQPRWEGLGLGLTWRTPWSGQLTVGADNVITRGRNPFSTSADGTAEEGTVPYVRYEQDL
ncbi:MAG TPA: hypothetical protein VFF93_10490 [Luteimonas sp.]|jgi:hypothetical protein|nr:hypothetical protein [Luteimonas sp.]